MNRKKIFFNTILVCALILILNINFSGLNLNNTASFKNDSSDKSQSEIHFLKKEISLMASRLDEIEKSQKQLAIETELKINGVVDNVKNNSASFGIDSNENAELEEFQPDDSHIVDSIVTNLDEQIYSGVKDEQWTTSLESKINDLFDVDLDKNVSLLDIRCETSLCKIEVEHNDADSKILLMSNISKIDAFNNQETFYKTVVNNDGSEITSLYVAREGFSLPGISVE